MVRIPVSRDALNAVVYNIQQSKDDEFLKVMNDVMGHLLHCCEKGSFPSDEMTLPALVKMLDGKQLQESLVKGEAMRLDIISLPSDVEKFDVYRLRTLTSLMTKLKTRN